VKFWAAFSIAWVMALAGKTTNQYSYVDALPRSLIYLHPMKNPSVFPRKCDGAGLDLSSP
jgi:hypothetical protein